MFTPLLTLLLSFWGIFFVDISSASTADQAFCSLAQMHGVGDDVEAFKRWLTHSTDAWLLFLDNADDPAVDVSRYIPVGGRGTIIITTRNPDCRIRATAGSSQVGEMSRSEAISLLLRASGEEHTEDSRRNRAQPVVENLGRLALGIIHAGAVIRQKLYTFEEYCDAYKSRRKDLLNLQPGQASSDYQYTVYTTWEISINSIKTIALRSTDGTDQASITAANALDLLTLFGFCHFDGIAENIFQHVQENICDFERDYPWWISNQLCMFREKTASGWDPLPFRHAISLLCSYSLIRMTGTTISLHPLVHSWVRDALDDRMHLRWWTISLSTLAMAVATSDLAYRYNKGVLTHTRSCLGGRMLGDFFVEGYVAHERAYIMKQLIDVHCVCGQYQEGQILTTRTLKYSKKTLGDGHEMTWWLLRACAVLCNKIERYQETMTSWRIERVQP